MDESKICEISKGLKGGEEIRIQKTLFEWNNNDRHDQTMKLTRDVKLKENDGKK